MTYIDWYSERTAKQQKFLKSLQPNHKKWQDLATETQYFISNEIYNYIYAIGIDKIRQYKKQDNLEALEQFFFNCKENDETALFPELPYLTSKTFKCARLCDYVCFRTACLYALKYESIKNSADIEAQKRKIRMQGLTWGFINDSQELEEISELQQIEQFLKGTKESKICFLKDNIDFVKGGAIKIKQYYLETNKIPEIRGASILLDTINDKKIPKLISKTHIKECLIYSGGGKMMGIFPAGTGEDICKNLELLVEQETITAQSNFCSCSYELGELFCNYKKIVQETDLILEERQNLRWDFRIEPQTELKDEKKELFPKGYRYIKENRKELCTSCRNRHAVAEHLNEQSEEKLCQSCLYKRLIGGKDARHTIYQRYREYISLNYHEQISDNGNTYNTLEDIAENGFIGVIYGDANSMSRQINQLESFMMMSHFSKVTSNTVTEIVFEALYHNLGNKLSFEIIALGGDDIFLIVPAKHAYNIACEIGEHFDKKLCNQSICENKMTMSMGVCITHHKLPVQYSFGIAQELLKSAKQRAWEEQQKGNITGTIDWMVIENEFAGSADLEYRRKRQENKPISTLRPYTWEQAKAMKIFIKQIEKEKALAFQLRQSWYQHTQEESELFYEYQISRRSKNDIPTALKKLAEVLNAKAVKHNIKYQNCLYSPWLDTIEIWDYMEDTE
ncbi:MAG: hypothetical protein HFH65_01310 [Lachnospiraceae bacterium]|nr:hypothetical protein [Lachnospiraceae bacterium]